MLSSFFSEEATSAAKMQLTEWRARVLDGILRGSLVFWLIALAGGINSVFVSYQQEAHLHSPEQAMAIAASVIAVYVGIVALVIVLTYNRRLGHNLRAGGFLLIFYLIGTFQLSLAALSGDGRLILIAFVVLTAVLFGLRHSLFALALSLLTLAAVGGLVLSGQLAIPVERQVNADDLSAWLSGGILFTLLSIMLIISAGYLIRALARSGADTRRRAEQLAALHAIGLEMGAQRELPALLQLIVRHLVRLIDAQGGGMYRMLPDGETLEFAVQHNLGDEALGNRLRLGEGLSGRVAQTGQPLIVGDYPQWPGRATNISTFGFRSLLGVPVTWRGQMLGVLNAHHTQPNFFDASDVEVALLLAQQAAQAIVNNRLLDEATRALAREQRLNEVARIISGSLDLPTLLQNVVRLAAELTEAEGGTLTMLTPDEQALTHTYLFNLPDELRESPASRGQGISWQVIESGQPALLEDYAAYPAALPRWVEAGLRAVICVPVSAGERPLGSLDVFMRDPHKRFDEHDMALVEAVGRQAGIAIQNARLFEAERRHVAALTALHHTGLALSTQLDWPTLLKTIIARAAQLLEAPMGELTLLQPDGETLVPVMGYQMPADIKSTPIRKGEGLAGRVAASGASLIVEDHRAWVHRTGAYDHPALRSALGVPILWHGQVTGVISISDTLPARFTPADAELVELFAAQAAAALENARLFEAREAREAYFRALVENSFEGISVVDVNGAIRYQSPYAARFVGHSTEEFLNDRWLAASLIHPDDLPTLAQVFRDSLTRPGMTRSMEVRVRHKEGHWLNIEIIGHNLLYDPHVTGAVFNYRDITARKQAEAALRASEEKFRHFVEQSVDGIMLTDEQGTITEWNRGQAHITGLAPEEALGRPLWDIQTQLAMPGRRNPALHQYSRARLQSYFETGQAPWPNQLMEMTIQRPDGAQGEMQVMTFPIPTENGFAMGSITRDITERKRAEAALQAANTELAQAVRRAEQLAAAAEEANRLKNEFLAITSHELRTPLTIIIGALDIVISNLCETPAEERQFSETAMQAARNLLTIVNQLLEMARLEANQIEVRCVPFDVTPVLCEAYQQFQPQAAARQLQLEFHTPEAMPLIYADPDRVTQIVWDVVGNALKFTETGRVVMSGHHRPGDKVLHIRVEDTGIGIALEKQARLFRPFVQADGGTARPYGGLGLGLTIAQRLAQLMGGSLTLYSAGEGRGSTVTVTLPVAEETIPG